MVRITPLEFELKVWVEFGGFRASARAWRSPLPLPFDSPGLGVVAASVGSPALDAASVGVAAAALLLFPEPPPQAARVAITSTMAPASGNRMDRIELPPRASGIGQTG
jgi:hypothetical protein